MFNDFDSEVVGFEPRPETERLMNDKSSQTVILETSNQKTQTSTASSVAVQASNETLSPLGNHPYDAEKLSKFLKRILPDLEEELKNHGSSNSELSFNENFNDVSSFGVDEQELVQRSMQKIIISEFSKEKIVSALTWNSSNVLLAVACSEKSHSSWCCHDTKIGIYNTGKFQFNKRDPSSFLQVPGCIRCIEFHNSIPSLLAAGFYSGEVFVWDLKLDEPALINKKESGDEAAHVDIITCLAWREDEHCLWLVSAGRDGRIILWKVITINLTYEIHERFLLLKQHLTSTAGPSEHLEVVHMGFRSSESPHFVVAGGGGTAFYCSMTTARPLSAFPRYKDPVLQSYKPRQGIITSVSCLPDLFASSGTDSEIHIFKYEQETPVLKIYTSYSMLVGIQWISSKELISWGDSKVSHHKIHQPSEEKLVCNVEEEISTVAFATTNLKYRQKLAIGNQAGGVVIFSNLASL